MVAVQGRLPHQILRFGRWRDRPHAVTQITDVGTGDPLHTFGYYDVGDMTSRDVGASPSVQEVHADHWASVRSRNNNGQLHRDRQLVHARPMTKAYYQWVIVGLFFPVCMV
jgi:hypothetical protein